MRDTKFRGKRKDNGKWAEGYLLVSENGFTYIADSSSICHYTPTTLKVFPCKVISETVEIEVCGRWFKGKGLSDIVKKSFDIGNVTDGPELRK